MPLPVAEPGFAEQYERSLVQPLFRPWAERLLQEVAPAPGEALLDVACGTGTVARLAYARLGRGTVVGVDISAAMLGVARQAEPAIDWREGDAAALPLAEGEHFDVVVCQQGLQFFPDRLAAARQMQRALRSGGRLAVSTWRPDEELPFLHALREVAQRHVGPIDDRRHAFGDGDALQELLRSAGLREVRCKVEALTVRFADPAVFVRMNAMALIGFSQAADADPARRASLLDAVQRDSQPVVAPAIDAGGLAYELRANVATGIA